MKPQNTNRKFTPEVKKHFLEIISTYKAFQEQMHRQSDIVDVAETLGGIVEAAKHLTISEAGDWFDNVTIKRNMSELEKLDKAFDKVAVDAKSLDERLHALYEDMGNILGRYYEISDIDTYTMKRRLGMKDKNVDNISEGVITESMGGLKFILLFIRAGEKFGIIDKSFTIELRNTLIKAINRGVKAKMGVENLPTEQQKSAYEIINKVIEPLKNATDAKSLSKAIVKVESFMSNIEKFKKGYVTEVVINEVRLKDAYVKIKSMLGKGQDWWVENRGGILTFLVEVIAQFVVEVIFAILGAILKTKIDAPNIKLGGKGNFGSGGGGATGKWDENMESKVKELVREEVRTNTLNRLNEGSGYTVYHNSYTSAVDVAIKFAEKKGYVVDTDDVWNQISTGPKKPSEGKTNKFSLGLIKGEKVDKKKLQIQIYGMGNGRYELNMYIQ
jgi:hypothetical protein